MILRPKQSYLICASPRSGSTLLCNLLTQAGAGKPHSFFRVKSIADWADGWGLPHVTPETYGVDYIVAAIAAGTDGTDVFGMRTMWDSVEPLLARLAVLNGVKDDLAQLTDQFGPLKFIHLSRKDRIAQAVSLAIAEQTGLWHRHADGSILEQTKTPQVPVYDHDAIVQQLDGLNADAANWARWFAKTQIAPHILTYENLASDPQGELATLLTFLGHDPTIARSVKPGTAKLADQTNADWVARFRAETGLPPTGQPS